MTEAKSGPRISPPNPHWEQDLVLRNSPPSGKADAWDELNHLDPTYLEFSMTSDVLRGLMLCLGLVAFVFSLLGMGLIGPLDSDSVDMGNLLLVGLPSLVLAFVGVFFFRLDLCLPKDRPVRFNRRRGKVYANYYTWNHNPFGRWAGGVKVFNWGDLQAEITRHVGASGEVITQRYSLELVACKPGTFEELDRFRLQQGAQTTKQYEEQWELIRRYMNFGPEGLPKQNLRNQTPGFVDCLLFAMPWFAPTEMGRRTRARMGAGYWFMAILLGFMFPLWLIFGLGNFVVMRLAPEASWPLGADEASKQ